MWQESPYTRALSSVSHTKPGGISNALYRRVHKNNSFRDLKVWQASMNLVEDVYRVTTGFPSDERFGLITQLRRAAVSVPSNIGEGKRRKRQRAFDYHLDIALGSQGEIEVQLEVARRIGFLSENDYARLQKQVEEVGRMLNGLLSSMQDQADS